MKKLNCLIVDDEPPALDILRSYIENTPMLQIAGACNHAVEAFEFLQQHPVDLMFLDINLPRLTGIEFFKALTNPPKVIFTTAHRTYAVDGFELGAVDYLLKPYSLERFWRAVQRATNFAPQAPEKEKVTSENERFLYVRADRKMVKIIIDEILYVESLKDYVKIVLQGRQIITKQTISALEEMLPEEAFTRIHRSFIVPLKKIESYTQGSVFIGKAELPVGPLYKHSFIQKVTEFNY
jgi:DNA-binding LytR/AlgR family response regulator